MVRELLQDGEERMGKAVDALASDLRTIRTGRANPTLLDRLTVTYYGTPTPLNQLAGVSAPEGRLLVIKPYDPSILRDVERSILESDLGLTPNNDGQVIRLVLPQLTQERRHELTKLVHRRTEEGRIAVRNIRRDVLKDLDTAQSESMITEDDLFRAKDRVQELTDRYIKQMEEIADEKEKEILDF